MLRQRQTHVISNFSLTDTYLPLRIPPLHPRRNSAWLEKQAEWEGTHRKAWDEHHKEGRVNSRIHSELEKMREEFVTAKVRKFSLFKRLAPSGQFHLYIPVFSSLSCEYPFCHFSPPVCIRSAFQLTS